MKIEINPEYSTTIAQTLSKMACTAPAVVVEYEDGGSATVELVRADERDDHGVNLIAHPWPDGAILPDDTQTLIIPTELVHSISPV